jgi:DNA modification methylase
MTPFWSDNAVTLFNADCRAVLAELEPESVHTCCTSPPYFALRSYKDGDEPVAPVLWADGTTACLGLEPTIAAYLDHLVESFQAVKRVLRSDGTCWVVIGDSYNSGSNFNHDRAGLKGRVGYSEPEKGSRTLLLNLQPLDLCLVPSRLALALQADGWIVRSFIIWSKGRSFDPDGAGSCMPESCRGWAWERHKVKIGNVGREQARQAGHFQDHSGNVVESDAKWQDCPGCPICLPNDLLVLRKGSWRPTHAYDVVLMLAKTGSYYGDDVAVREVGADGSDGSSRWGGPKMNLDTAKAFGGESMPDANPANRPGRTFEYSGTRNLRDVWYITPQPRKEPHYATYPDKLVETIVKAATSEAGVCGKCGAPLARVVRTNRGTDGRTDVGPRHGEGYAQSRLDHRGKAPSGLIVASDTLGWRATCTCDAGEPVPAVVLDCFAGIGTSLLVARELGRRAIGIEISQGYSEIAAAKLTAQAKDMKRQAEELARRERDRNMELGLEEEP